MKKLLVAIPFYNEKENLPKLIDNIPKIKNYDICFINDGSTDDSNKLIDNKFQIITHEKNKGYGAAVISAIKYAKKKQYEYLCIFPGDNQRKFEDIDKLYQKINSSISYDIIVGSKFRMLKSIPIKRKFGNYFFSKLSKIWGNKIDDVMSGFKIYKIDTIINIINDLPENYSLDVCLNYIANKKNFQMVEIDVFCNYKNQTSKMTNIIIVSIKIIFDLLKTIIGFKSHDKK